MPKAWLIIPRGAPTASLLWFLAFDPLNRALRMYYIFWLGTGGVAARSVRFWAAVGLSLVGWAAHFPASPIDSVLV